MNSNRSRTLAAMVGAGLLWGTTVPLSKLALHWMAPGWLTFARFAVAAAILLPAARRQLRAVLRPSVLVSGAVGYGGSVVVQNAGITRTSVTHAALLIGTVPVLVAIIAAVWHRTVARPVAWAGFALSLAGVGLVTGGRGGGASAAGDALVLASLLMSAAFTVAQTRLLAGRDPAATTAVQFLGAALAALPFAALTEAAPGLPGTMGALLATAGLSAGGTLLPFALFAYAQSRVPAEVAGAFLNIEPLVGAVAGAVFFGDPAGPGQLAGGAAILGGIALSSLPLLAAGRAARPAAGLGPEDRRRSAHLSAHGDRGAGTAAVGPHGDELVATGRHRGRERAGDGEAALGAWAAGAEDGTGSLVEEHGEVVGQAEVPAVHGDRGTGRHGGGRVRDLRLRHHADLMRADASVRDEAAGQRQAAA